MGKIVSKKEFGELIGKSPRWISKLIEDGLPTAGGGGRGVEVQIDSEAAISWLIAREVRREMGEEGDDEDGLNSASTEDRLLKKARREKWRKICVPGALSCPWNMVYWIKYRKNEDIAP